MTKLGSIIAALVLSLGFSATAHARVVEYVSQHPVPHKYGGGFCYIDVPHVHNYAPSDPRMYRENNGQNYFVGDPAPFDYDGPRYSVLRSPSCGGCPDAVRPSRLLLH